MCRFVVCLLQKQLHISLLISRYLFDSSFNVTTPQVVNVLSTQDFHIKLPNGCGFEIFQARKHNWPRL